MPHLSIDPPTALPRWRDRVFHARGVGPLALRLYDGSTVGERKTSAVVLHFHAGAFVGGGLDAGAGVASCLAVAGAEVAALAYPLAPAHPFPQAIEAGYEALCWLDKQRRRSGAGPASLWVAGEEAGANIACAIAMMARDRGGPALAGTMLFSPMLDVCVATASQRSALAGPVGCVWADGWRAYLAGAHDAIHPYAAPGQAQRLGGLPPTLLLTANDDALRDETHAFALRLRAAKVPVDLVTLVQPTGWPRSYLLPENQPWADALTCRVRAFMNSAG